MLAFLPACLVTDKPDLEPPTTTRPQLIEDQPRTTEFLQRELGEPIAFNAKVLSEDAGIPLKLVLLVDYGVETGGVPWREDVTVQSISAGALSDGPREIRTRYTPGGAILPGCHTVTLLATHAIIGQAPDVAPDSPYYWCPVDADDYDTLTWFLSVCDQGDCPFDCPFDDGSYTYCPSGPSGTETTAP